MGRGMEEGEGIGGGGRLEIPSHRGGDVERMGAGAGGNSAVFIGRKIQRLLAAGRLKLVQSKYEERVRKGLMHKEGLFNPRPGVIYLGNLPLLRPCEIPWLEREDYEEDISCGSSKGKEIEVETSGKEAKYFDPFEDIDDILCRYSNGNKGKVEAQRKSILGEVEKEADKEFKSDND
ncbi:hypothetical protein Tco_0640307 [Tanacetum coccineum]